MALDLHHGDCLVVLKDFPDNHFDSIVCDPPAGISFMGAKWDSDFGGRDHWIAWMQSIASECLRVLKPGGHALVWALPRTSHWTATAWENAGFECRDVIHHVFGSGFPKSHNISKAIDREAGMEAVISPNIGKWKAGSTAGAGAAMFAKDGEKTVAVPHTAMTDAAKQWDGYGTALKPAVENWILLRKPLEKGLTVAANVQKWSTGALNIDGCRVPGDWKKDPVNVARQNTTGGYNRHGYNTESIFDVGPRSVTDTSAGRFPANLILGYGPDEYTLKDNITEEERRKVADWLSDNGHLLD